MKKILIYYKQFFSGGTEHAILNHISKFYNDFKIYVAYDEDGNSDVVLKNIKKYASIIDLREITNINVDIAIICSHSRFGSFNDFSTKVIATKYFYWCHIVMFKTFNHFEFKKDLRNGIDKFICVSPVVKNDIIKIYPELESKCYVLENYLNTNEIIENSKQGTFNVMDNCLNIVSVSRIAKEKGFHRMKILCDLFDKHNINYQWYVLGNSFLKEVYDEITNMFQGNKNVHFLGYTDNVYPYIKNMDYLALLSDSESWGLVITESLILGVPCIVSNFEGADLQIKDNYNGVILNMNNEDNLYEKSLDKIINNKKIYKNNISKNTLDFNWIIDEWYSLFN